MYNPSAWKTEAGESPSVQEKPKQTKAVCSRKEQAATWGNQNRRWCHQGDKVWTETQRTELKLEAEGQTESDTHSIIKSLRHEHHVHVTQLSPVSPFALCVCSGIHNKKQTRSPRKEICFLHIRGSVSPHSTCRKVSGATSFPGLQREPVHCVFA